MTFDMYFNQLWIHFLVSEKNASWLVLDFQNAQMENSYRKSSLQDLFLHCASLSIEVI